MALSSILLGRVPPGGAGEDLYPLTIQNLQWLVFFVGLGELWLRFLAGGADAAQLRARLLPEDDETMLRARDLPAIYARLNADPLVRDRPLRRIVRRIILQFQGSKSIDQANSLLNSSLELIQHEVDLRYNMLRYVTWLIPTLGFIGTVIGIAVSLSDAAVMPDLEDTQAIKAWVGTLTVGLGIAFYTTFLALCLSAILVFLMHLAQGREEQLLNDAGQYCLDNLINRLYED